MNDILTKLIYDFRKFV